MFHLKSFKFLNRIKIFSITDREKKERIQEIFAENKIPYRIRVKDAYRKNPYDAAATGSMGNNGQKLIYSFYVDQENAQLAAQLIREME